MFLTLQQRACGGFACVGARWMSVFAHDRSSHRRSLHGRSECERSSPQSGFAAIGVCRDRRARRRRRRRQPPAGLFSIGVFCCFLTCCFLLFLLFFVAFCCFLLHFVAFCCILLLFVGNNHVGAKIRLLRVKTTHLEAPELFFFCLLRCCWTTKRWEHKKQNFTGQNSNLSGVCGRLCSLLCGVATKMWEQPADFCQTNLGK